MAGVYIRERRKANTYFRGLTERRIDEERNEDKQNTSLSKSERREREDARGEEFVEAREQDARVVESLSDGIGVKGEHW